VKSSPKSQSDFRVPLTIRAPKQEYFTAKLIHISNVSFLMLMSTGFRNIALRPHQHASPVTNLMKTKRKDFRFHVSTSGAIVGIVLMLAMTAAILLAMGRPPICTCGYVALWHGAIDGGNSQHLLDWYSPSHVIHGFLFCGATWLLLRHLPVRLRLLIAVAIEAAWELTENSPMVIDRYRTATMALGYTGDSVLNSLSDISCMMIGFAIARHLPVWATIALAITFELLTLAVIRDNLTLNILMLVWPVDAIRHWQAG